MVETDQKRGLVGSYSQTSRGLSGAAWGILRLPGDDLFLIPDFKTDPILPPIFAFFPPTVHD